MKKNFFYLLFILFLGLNYHGVLLGCKELHRKKVSSKIELDKSKDSSEVTSNIRFGFRGESIVYNLNGTEYEIGTTYVNESRVYLDDLDNTDLSRSNKSLIFKDIVDYINETEKRKPVIFYNSDLKSSELWGELCEQYSNRIKRVEVTTTEQENEEFYKFLVESIENDNAEHNFNGLIIRTVEDLDKHWDEIKK